ncbi:probable RNA methyltransferase At5g51130 isoform X2 [Magnolia sinica]|uniref:probable RNA methyltransferase At5g51130 isoform X2 n=1 Tax=Magnolia sinica TaxID=86752 RepID=UPI002659D399|nr:probable RNA methyltransferase At5g51130 isoform X2 [Magnolia sinica]
MAEEEKEKEKNLKNNQNARKRKRKDVFIYGNYKSYYGYRIGHDKSEDPRLAMLNKEWFEDKDCLDIGCNQGLITIAIAKKFSCRSILGVDIDASLVENANWNLRRIARMENASGKSVNASTPDLLERVNGLDQNTCASLGEVAVDLPKEPSPLKEHTLLERVSFQTENIIKSMNACWEKYNTILCLSVTKWIHLNWGDDGLITLFVKIWRLLRPGGILILEPQPWKSYKNNRLVSETAKYNFNCILFKPEMFQELLLDKIGFRTVETITNNTPGSVVGFDRPIFVFHK